MSEQELDGAVAFITGTTRGIGKATALELADKGCKVVSTGRTTEPQEDRSGTIYKTVDEIEARGGEALAVELDVRDADSVRSAISKTIAEFGRIDILFNNAAAMQLGGIAETPPNRFDLVMNVNLRGAFYCIHYALPHMRERGYGHILNNAPPLSAKGNQIVPVYGLSKVGLTYLTLTLAKELHGEGIGVNTIWPVANVRARGVEKYNVPDESLREPSIMAEAARHIVSRDPGHCSGNTFYDEEVVREVGERALDEYSVVDGATPPPNSAQVFDPDYTRPDE